MLTDDSKALATRFLDVIERRVVPLTEEGVRRGDKVFGAAILRKIDGSLLIAASNEETDCPLWHGEIVAIRDYHRLPAAERPAPSDCLFLSTHEPCPLCLSAIAWAGFDNFYYLFSYESSRDDFSIPHDLRILEEVFGCSDGSYRASNAYWTGHDLNRLIAACGDMQPPLAKRVERLRKRYAAMSETYQATKGSSTIPLA